MSKNVSKNAEKVAEEKENIEILLDFNHIQRFATVSGITLGSILAFAGLGYWIDTLLDTKPWFLLIGMIISFPLTQIMLIRKMKSMAPKKKESTKKPL